MENSFLLLEKMQAGILAEKAVLDILTTLIGDGSVNVNTKPGYGLSAEDMEDYNNLFRGSNIKSWKNSIYTASKTLLNLLEYKPVGVMYWAQGETGGAFHSFYSTLRTTLTSCLGKNFNISRWNPSDVWYVSGTTEVEKADKYLDSIAANITNSVKNLSSAEEKLQFLTEYMNDLFRKGKIIGISLKKLGYLNDNRELVGRCTVEYSKDEFVTVSGEHSPLQPVDRRVVSDKYAKLAVNSTTGESGIIKFWYIDKTKGITNDKDFSDTVENSLDISKLNPDGIYGIRASYVDNSNKSSFQGSTRSLRFIMGNKDYRDCWVQGKSGRYTLEKIVDYFGNPANTDKLNDLVLFMCSKSNKLKLNIEEDKKIEFTSATYCKIW